MQSTPVSAEASEQLVHGVPVSYISRVASEAAAVAHREPERARASIATALGGQRADSGPSVGTEPSDS